MYVQWYGGSRFLSAALLTEQFWKGGERAGEKIWNWLECAERNSKVPFTIDDKTPKLSYERRMFLMCHEYLSMISFLQCERNFKRYLWNVIE